MKEYIEAGVSNNKILFRWDIIDSCQYACSYCYFNNNDIITEDEQKHKTIVNTVLKKLSTINEDFVIELLGGEPTLYKDLESVIATLNDNEHCKKITLITNFHNDNKYFIELMKYEKLRLTVSYHAEYAHNFIDKLKALVPYVDIKRITATVNIHDNIKYKEDVETVVKELKEIGITGTNLDINFLLENHRFKPNYDLEWKLQIAEGDTYGIPHKYKDNDKIVKELVPAEDSFNMSYKGWHCTPLLFNIDLTGTIRNCCTKKSFFTLKNLSQEIICGYDYCGCYKKLSYKKFKKD